MVDLPGVLGAGGDQVNAGGVDAAVAQHVGQHGDVVAGAVKGAGKQMPQVVRVHLAGGHAGQAAKGFHLGPDLPAANAAAAFGAEDLAGGNALAAGKLFQLAAQPPRQQNGPHLAFQADLGAAAAHRLAGDVPQLRHTDAGGADGLQQQGKALAAGPAGGVQQTVVVGAGQLAAGVAEGAALHPQKPRPKLRPAGKAEKAVKGDQHAVDGGRRVTGVRQMRFPRGGRAGLRRRAAQPPGKGGHAAAVGLDGAGGFFPLLQVAGKRPDAGGGQAVSFHKNSFRVRGNGTAFIIRYGREREPAIRIWKIGGNPP